MYILILFGLMILLSLFSSARLQVCATMFCLACITESHSHHLDFSLAICLVFDFEQLFYLLYLITSHFLKRGLHAQNHGIIAKIKWERLLKDQVQYLVSSRCLICQRYINTNNCGLRKYVNSS